MANHSLSENPLDVKSNTIEIPVPGRVFTYQVTRITERCIILEAAHTGARKPFDCPEALTNYIAELRQHLYSKYGVL